MINKSFPMETTGNRISGWEKSMHDGPEPKALPSMGTYWSVLTVLPLELRKNSFYGALPF